jgi:hypothetical protein
VEWKEGGKYLDRVGPTYGQHNAAGFMVPNQHVAGLHHSGKRLLQEDVLPSDPQSREHHGLNRQLPLPQRLAVLHEVGDPLELFLQKLRYKDFRVQAQVEEWIWDWLKT